MTGEDGSAVQLEVTKIESGEASVLQRAEDAVIIAGNDIVMNVGIYVVDNVGDYGVPAVDTAHTSYHEVEIIDGRKVISDSVGAECSKIEGKWDGKADLHREPVVKDFMEIINNMRNNMRKDFNSTLSRWAGEHSLQYLESPAVKDFTLDSVTYSSDVVEDILRKDSISTRSGWAGEHSLQHLESPSSEEEAVYTVCGQGRENEAIKHKEVIVAEPTKPPERKVGVNVKLLERKFDEEEGRQIMNNDFDTEEGWDDDENLGEGDIRTEDRKKVVKIVSQNSFRFGDKQVYRSQGFIETPVWIGGKRRTEHQEAGDQDKDCGSVLLVIENDRDDLYKMHEQWSHPPRARMISILKKAGQWKDSMEAIIEEIYKNCHSRDCRTREQTQKVRKVGTKLPSKPGQMVAVDLKISSGYDKAVELKMWDRRYPLEAGRDSLCSRELQSILCSGAPSDRNPGHEDQLQEPPPTQVSGGNVASEANTENVSDVRIVDNSIYNCSMMVDSRSLCDTVKATTTLRDKRAMVGICALRRAPDIASEDLKIKWCDATSQVADPLTKGGANPDLLRSVLQLGQPNIVGIENTDRMRRRRECDHTDT